MTAQGCGWSNVLRGRLASEWFLAHTAVAHNPAAPHGLGSLPLGPTWSTPCGTAVSLWSNRHDDLYGANDTAHKALQLSKLNACITYAYSVQNEVDVSDLHIFCKPLASRLLASLSCNLS